MKARKKIHEEATKTPLPEVTIRHEYGRADLPYKVKLIKGQKESYGWEISVSGTDTLDILRKAKELNKQLRDEYGAKEV